MATFVSVPQRQTNHALGTIDPIIQSAYRQHPTSDAWGQAVPISSYSPSRMEPRKECSLNKNEKKIALNMNSLKYEKLDIIASNMPFLRFKNSRVNKTSIWEKTIQELSYNF